MAGRFEALSDLEWQLFADIFPLRQHNGGVGCLIPPFARS
jgi:hypothetical protein